MRTFYLHILFSLIACFSQAQKAIVILEVEPKEAEVGEMLTITVKSNVQGEIDIDLPSGFVHGYQITNGMNQEIDYNTGKVINYFYLSQNGAMPKAGTFKFGPAYIKKGNKVYRSNTVNVTIRKENTSTSPSSDDISSKQMKQPAFGIIEKSKSVLYEGEPLILNAKVYSRFDPSHLEDYQEYNLDGAIDKHEINASARITVKEENVKKIPYYSFEYDKKVIFPIGTGRMTIDPFKLTLRRGIEGLPLTSSSTLIEVKPLPGNVPADFVGGVGQFTIAQKVNTNATKQGEVITLTIEISGYGNLQNVSEPKLILPKGFVIYGDAIIKEDISFGNRGAEGKITYEYNIQVTKFGSLTIPKTSISYFDPVKEKYIQISTGENQLSVTKNASFKVSDNTTTTLVEKAEEDVQILRTENEYAQISDFWISSPTFWIGFTAPLSLALLIGLFWRKREENKEIGLQKTLKKKSQQSIQHLFSEAEAALNSGDFTNYYSLIEKGMQRSMALYLRNDDSITLSKATIFEELNARNVPENNITALKSLFTTCEEARYGFGISPENRDALVVSAKQVTQTILSI